jgi:hypothetical protein
LVPVSPTSNIAIRPGNLGNGCCTRSWKLVGRSQPEQEFSRFRKGSASKIRADMFNALNHVNLGGPSTGLNGATFGEINGAGGYAGHPVQRPAAVVMGR